MVNRCALRMTNIVTSAKPTNTGMITDLEMTLPALALSESPYVMPTVPPAARIIPCQSSRPAPSLSGRSRGSRRRATKIVAIPTGTLTMKMACHPTDLQKEPADRRPEDRRQHYGYADHAHDPGRFSHRQPSTRIVKPVGTEQTPTDPLQHPEGDQLGERGGQSAQGGARGKQNKGQ